MPTAVLSPHFDDAVLSCWGVLEGAGDVTVVNVFTGLPVAGAPPGWWDEATGTRNSAARMHERGAEDRAALALAGRTATNLGMLDAQYRTRDGVAPARLVAALRGVLAPDDVVLAPAGLGGHPDHESARDAALALAADGWRVRLYADLPHAIRRGWPGWVAGDAEMPGADVGAGWEGELAAAGVCTARLVPRVLALDAPARARKLRALAAYRTQRAALDDIGFAALDDPRTLAYEVSWEVPSSALDRAHQPVGEAPVGEAGGQHLHDRG